MRRIQMVEELVENIEAFLRLNTIGDMSDGLTLNYIRASLNNYKKQKKLQSKKTVQEEIHTRNTIATHYRGVNPND